MKKKERDNLQVGELTVFPGTNEIGLIIRKSGEGCFSERLKKGEMGFVAIVGKIPKKHAGIYWERRSKSDENL